MTCKSFLNVSLFCLCFSVVVAAQQSPNEGKTPWRNLVGTWKLVPRPDDATVLKVEPEGEKIKFSFSCKEDGSCSDTNIGNYDGKRYQDSANVIWTSSFRKTAVGGIQQDDYVDDNLSQTVNWQVSADGRSLTRTSQSATPSNTKAVTVKYVRSGGPESKDDPFVGFWKRDWNKSDVIVIRYADKGDVFTFSGPSGNTDERRCDGKDHPNGNIPGTVYSCSFPDEHTYEVVFKANGKLVVTRTTVVSEDGKSMVRTDKSADGRARSQQVYEKFEQ